MTAIQVFYSGRVQGVGFRYTVKSLSKGYEVVGWVRNLMDGRVEMHAQSASEKELQAFLNAIQESVLAAHIRDVQSHAAEHQPTLKDFLIR